MKPYIILTTFAFVTASYVTSAYSQQLEVRRPNADNGERLARRWCAACHVVTVNQRRANADAPPFEEIAKRPDFSESGLVTFLLDPHSKMPNMNLTRVEASDIVAYISTLR
jgi:mono/diheme cytochrome c family protein